MFPSRVPVTMTNLFSTNRSGTIFGLGNGRATTNGGGKSGDGSPKRGIDGATIRPSAMCPTNSLFTEVSTATNMNRTIDAFVNLIPFESFTGLSSLPSFSDIGCDGPSGNTIQKKGSKRTKEKAKHSVPQCLSSSTLLSSSERLRTLRWSRYSSSALKPTAKKHEKSVFAQKRDLSRSARPPLPSTEVELSLPSLNQRSTFLEPEVGNRANGLGVGTEKSTVEKGGEMTYSKENQMLKENISQKRKYDSQSFSCDSSPKRVKGDGWEETDLTQQPSLSTPSCAVSLSRDELRARLHQRISSLKEGRKNNSDGDAKEGNRKPSPIVDKNKSTDSDIAFQENVKERREASDELGKLRKGHASKTGHKIGINLTENDDNVLLQFNRLLLPSSESWKNKYVEPNRSGTKLLQIDKALQDAEKRRKKLDRMEEERGKKAKDEMKSKLLLEYALKKVKGERVFEEKDFQKLRKIKKSMLKDKAKRAEKWADRQASAQAAKEEKKPFNTPARKEQKKNEKEEKRSKELKKKKAEKNKRKERTKQMKKSGSMAETLADGLD